MNQLHYVLRGIKLTKSEDVQENRTRLPMSPNVLRKMKRVWEANKTLSCYGQHAAYSVLWVLEDWRDGSPRGEFI